MSNIAKLSRPARLRCESCGATAEAACDCGVAYVPAGQKAAAAIMANPGLSNRAIAQEIGVSNQTVMRARQAGAPDGAPDQREGLDGKTYKLPQRSDSYVQRLARPPSQTIKLIMGLIGNLDPDQREDLFGKLRKRYRL